MLASESFFKSLSKASKRAVSLSLVALEDWVKTLAVTCAPGPGNIKMADVSGNMK